MKQFISIFFLFALVSCASYKSKYASSVKNWESTYQQNQKKKVSHTLYTVGDAGELVDGKVSPVIRHLRNIDLEDNSSIVFLGDNVYRHGLPNKEDVERTAAESKLDPQIELAKRFGKNAFFIPGNHDWLHEEGPKRVRRQEKYINKRLGFNSFQPSDACSGPEVIKLGHRLVMIVIDSEWFVQDWDQYIDFNEKCPYKNRESFLAELQNQIKKNKDNRVIIALHHPPYTYGSHGGNFGVKDHLFPLAALKKPIHVPLPGLGTLGTLLRKNAGINQDVYGKDYTHLRNELTQMIDVFDDIIIISGHDHNQQYTYLDDHHYIVSGSGAKSVPVGSGAGNEFSSGALGYSKVIYYEDGSSSLEMYEFDEHEQVRLAFAKKLTPPLEDFTTTVTTKGIPFPKEAAIASSIKQKDMTKGGLGNLFLGKQYSALYNLPISAPVTNLNTLVGGLKPLQRGGGFQTNSLRLEDENENHWVLRAVKKDPSRLLPDEFLGTVAVDAIDYFLTTAHPLAAFAIPPMAESVNILHTKPQLLYVPKQDALGIYNEDHGNQLYLFEDRPAGDRSDRDNFGNSNKIISTIDLLEKMKKNAKHQPDQQNVVRNRLFDMVIGDWDRHDDQWRWARFNTEDNTYSYRPIPRDRDQAFAIFQGILVGAGRMMSPGIGKFQTFDHKIKNVDYFNFNGRYFDRSFLNQLTWADWQREISHIQKNLTDQSIHEGLTSWPKEFYELHGSDIEDKLKSRRDGLEKWARTYYLSLAKEVDITATNDDDYILVEHHDNKHLTVTLYTTDKSGSKKQAYYKRSFNPKETKEIRIYGLDGDDHFEIDRDVRSSIKVRLLGGTDDDTYNGISGVKSKKNYIYDYPENSTIKSKNGLVDKMSNDYFKNSHDRKAFKYNHSLFLPNIGSNPDNGFLLGASFSSISHGFKKSPYKSKHSIGGLYSFETNGFKVNYDGHWIEKIGKWDLRLAAGYQDNLFSNNFFGIGNNTETTSNVTTEYNRVRQEMVNVKLFLEKRKGDKLIFHLGPIYERRNVENTSNRFISDLFLESDSPIFSALDYAGLEAGLTFKYLNNPALTSRGLNFKLAVRHLAELNNTNNNVSQLETRLAMYTPLDRKEHIVWANQVGTGINFDDRFQYYFGHQIGGSNNLRGFRNERFYGKSSLYFNTDLRVKLFQFNSYFIPSSVGIYGGGDLGRVFLDGEDSDKWHASYGGGLWIAPFDAAVLKVGYFTTSEEGGRLILGMGFDF